MGPAERPPGRGLAAEPGSVAAGRRHRQKPPEQGVALGGGEREQVGAELDQRLQTAEPVRIGGGAASGRGDTAAGVDGRHLLHQPGSLCQQFEQFAGRERTGGLSRQTKHRLKQELLFVPERS